MQKTVFKSAETIEAQIQNGWRSFGAVTLADGSSAERFAKGGCNVLVSREDHNGKMRWHLSISRRERYPGWNEIKDARYSLLPHELTFAQILPPPQNYTNVHRNCFHLWEIDHGEW